MKFPNISERRLIIFLVSGFSSIGIAVFAADLGWCRSVVEKNPGNERNCDVSRARLDGAIAAATGPLLTLLATGSSDLAPSSPEPPTPGRPLRAVSPIGRRPDDPEGA